MAKQGKLGLGSRGGAHRLLTGAGGSIGAGHSTPGGAPLSQLVPQGVKKPVKDGDKTAKVTQTHKFGPAGGPQGGSAAKGAAGAGAMRRTAPGG